MFPVLSLKIEGLSHEIKHMLMKDVAALDSDIQTAVADFCKPENLKQMVTAQAHQELRQLVQDATKKFFAGWQAGREAIQATVVDQLKAQYPEQARKAVSPAGQVLEPVHGDLLPPVGSVVEIHLASSDAWVPVVVVGYYVWAGLSPGSSASGGYRVFVRVKDKCGYLNARSLDEIIWEKKKTA